MMTTKAIPSSPEGGRSLRGTSARRAKGTDAGRGPMQDSVAPLIREAMTLDNIADAQIADALVRHATVHGCAGDQAVACRLRRMGRELRTKAMLKRGHAAAILGHELPTAGVR